MSIILNLSFKIEKVIKMNIDKEALEFHRKYRGKIEIKSKIPIKDEKNLSLAYTPGVAEPCRKIFTKEEKIYDYTSKGNMVAVVTDGSAVLGLGNIGAKASLPVMEGKAILFKEFAGIDAFPICLDTQDADKIVEVVKLISPVFGGINLEDISSPRCFEIERRLNQVLDIPVFHDDQHGTAVITLAALINALKIAGKELSEIKVVINGAGAAGIAIAKFLLRAGAREITLCDSKGIIYEGRKNGMNFAKEKISKMTNRNGKRGGLKEALEGTDVFIGVSAPNVLTKEMIKMMNPSPIIFAMSNPIPEVNPKLAIEAGALIVGTGRSDYPNQINNVLGFPGIFKGTLRVRAKEINEEMKLAASFALANLVKNEDLRRDHILPEPFDPWVAETVAQAVEEAAQKTEVAGNI